MEKRSKAVQEQVQDRIMQELDKQGIDAIIAASPHNILFSTGSHIVTIRLVPDRLGLALFSLQGPPTFLVCNIEESLVHATSPIEDVRPYTEFVDDPILVMADILEEQGLGDAVIAAEFDFLPYEPVAKLRERLPQITWRDGSKIWGGMRKVKEKHEIQILRQAAKLTVDAIERVLAFTHAGWRERQMSRALSTALLEAGAEEIAFNVLGSGSNSLMAHPAAGDRILTRGDIVRFDVGCSLKGYYGDVARTVSVEKSSERRIDTYRRLVEVHRNLVDRCRAGIRARELFEFCGKEYDRLGLPFDMPHIGHSIGLELHEEPMLSPRSLCELRPGMAINVEPIVLDVEDGAGYHLEDLVLITDDEPEVMTGSWPPPENMPRLEDAGT